MFFYSKIYVFYNYDDRFRYPERAIIAISFCYHAVSGNRMNASSVACKLFSTGIIRVFYF